MSEGSSNIFNCIICAKEFSGKDALQLHILRHLGYRRYACGSCTTGFYTEEERESHCKEHSHIHMFEMKVNQYNEMLIRQLLKDTELLSLYDLDFVIRERSKAGLSFEKSVENASPHVKRSSKNKNVPTSPAVSSRHTQRLSPTPADPEIDTTIKAKSPKKKRRSESVRRRSEGTSETTMDSVEWRPIQDTETEPIAAQIDRALETEIVDLKCYVCKKMINSHYEVRKNHVSLYHMPIDHEEDDYIDLLEHKMKECFPMWPYSDFQCQIPNCGKMYKSSSSRRYHVLSSHFNDVIACPMSNCVELFKDAFRANAHLKDVHDLRDGVKGIKNAVIKYKFEYEKRSHNSKLEKVIKKAFPCPIPAFSKTEKEKINYMGTIVRDTVDRRYQSNPPPPLRPRSSSSSSEDDSPMKRTHVNTETETSIEEVASNNSKSSYSKERRVFNNSVSESSETEHRSKTSKEASSFNSEKKKKKHKSPEKSARSRLDSQCSLNSLKQEMDTSSYQVEARSTTGSLSSSIKDEINMDISDSGSSKVAKEEAMSPSRVCVEVSKRKPLLATPPESKKLKRFDEQRRNRDCTSENEDATRINAPMTLLESRPSYTLPSPFMRR